MADLEDWIKVLISPIVTFIAFYFTYKVSKEQNAQTQLEISEQERIAILPFLDIKIEVEQSSIDYAEALKTALVVCLPEDNGLFFDRAFSISNIGQASAVGVTISPLNSSSQSTHFVGNVGKDQKVEKKISIFMSSIEPAELALNFEDIRGHKYYQTFRLIPDNPTNARFNANNVHFNAILVDMTSPQLKTN